ncbi:Transcriptional activator of proteases prtT [Pichia kudriavzevii]|uniref:Transcriptional activator of proteases prtT n=1 Tax=Pichia kudriavzevii TaxID=4909 RepID=A0A1V2LP36_PICKU|nr:Transcriptional activator of proteases prtT [Pichia kudriavzevii]
MADENGVQKKRRRAHTRASKACTFCRQQKTRCLRSDESVACLRCLSLKLDCSLLSETGRRNEFPILNVNLNSNHNNSINPVTQLSSQPVTRQSSLSYSKLPSPQPSQYQYEQSNSNHIFPSLASTLQNNPYERQPQFHPKYNDPVHHQFFYNNPIPPTSTHRLSQSFVSSHSPSQNYQQNNCHSTPTVNHMSSINDAEFDPRSTKIDSIDSTVKQILHLLRSDNRMLTSISESDKDISSDEALLKLLPILSTPINNTNIPNQSLSFSPISFLNLSTEISGTEQAISLPLCIQQQLYPLHSFRPIYQDIITTKILTFNQAVQLVDIFRDRYGRWLSFPPLISTRKLIIRLRKRCPLLLTLACLLSLKYGDPLLKQKIWYKLNKIVCKEIHWLNSTYSGSLEELQCLVILGAYCIGLSDLTTDEIENGNPILLLDGWHLSGVGLTLFEKINHYGFGDQMYGPEVESQWKANNEEMKEKVSSNLNPVEVSDISSATNFDFRIIGEIHIYLICYRFLFEDEPYRLLRKGINLWLERWQDTFGQASNQFVEIDYHFVEILVKIKSLKLDPHAFFNMNFNNLKELTELRKHALAILYLIDSVNDDSYFAFLSDQIHMMVFYATDILISTMSAINKLEKESHVSPSETVDNSQVNRDILNLIFRFRTVATTKNDTFYKYYSILERNYDSKLREPAVL